MPSSGCRLTASNSLSRRSRRTAAEIFKLMGDGLLAEFASAVDAVECAVDIQHGMAERNSGEPEDQRIDPTSGGPRSIPS